MFLSMICFMFFLVILAFFGLAGIAGVILVLPAPRRMALLEGIRARWASLMTLFTRPANRG